MQSMLPGSPATTAPASLSARPHWLVFALILLAVAAAYAYTLTFEFVYDDKAQIVSTSYVHSWKFASQYFREDIWSHKIAGGGSYYRPVFLLWLLTNYTLFGLRPEWWHLTTVSMHLTVTLLLYLVTLRLTRDRPIAALAALLFGLHPVHIESVAWISGVSDPLVAVLLLASFLCYLKGAGWRAAALVLYGLALLAKEPAVVLPALIFAHAWLFRPPTPDIRSRLRDSILAAAPYVALAGLYWIVRVIVLQNSGGAASHRLVPAASVLFTLPSLLWFYVSHLLWPARLSVVYNFPFVDRPGLWNFALPALLFVAIAAALYVWSRRSPLVGFASMWLLLTLLPVLNLRNFLRDDLVHDRYLYLPSIGFCLLVAIAIGAIRLGWAKLSVIPIACLLLVATVVQSRYWASNLTLFQRAVTLAPGNRIAMYGLGTQLLDLGMRAEALPVFQHLYELHPEMFDGNFGLGACYYHMDHVDLADKYLNRAVAMRPSDATALVLLGLTRLKQGRLPEAESYVRQAIQAQRLDDGSELYHAQLGYVLKLEGNLDAALREFKLEQAHFPNSPGLNEEIAETEQRLMVR